MDGAVHGSRATRGRTRLSKKSAKSSKAWGYEIVAMNRDERLGLSRSGLVVLCESTKVFDKRGTAEGAQEWLLMAVSWFVFGALWFCRFSHPGTHLRTGNRLVSYDRGDRRLGKHGGGSAGRDSSRERAGHRRG
jgi:hypothetical protein